MSFLPRFIFVVAIGLSSGCIATIPHGTLGPATEAALQARVQQNIAQGRWLDAYTALEPALTSTDPKEVTNAMATAAQHPELLRAADSVFEVDTIQALMTQRGKNVGRDLATIRLRAYRQVATKAGFELAQSNIQAAFDGFTDSDEALRIKRKAEIDAADARRAAEIAEKRKRVLEAADRARLICRDAADCSKAFALTQIFVSENADMKIQTANDTIIETFNPTENMKVGIKAVRFPRAGTSAEIRLTINCPANARTPDLERKMTELCLGKVCTTPAAA